MNVTFNQADELDAVLRTAAGSAGLRDASVFAPEVRTADPKHGD